MILAWVIQKTLGRQECWSEGLRPWVVMRANGAGLDASPSQVRGKGPLWPAPSSAVSGTQMEIHSSSQLQKPQDILGGRSVGSCDRLCPKMQSGSLGGWVILTR